TTDENIISSEFIGICCEKLEELYPGVTVTYLQGFCGDVRPNLIKNSDFYRGSYNDLLSKGRELYQDVRRELNNKGKHVEEWNFTLKECNINLLFSKKRLKNRVPERLKNEWENLIGNINKDYQLYLQYIKITDDLILLASNAEMVCNYGT